MAKIILAGGTGFIGTYLQRRFHENGDEVLVISRSGPHDWSHQSLVDSLEGADVLINLAGYTINCVHTAVNRDAIVSSRLKTTQSLAQAVYDCTNPPALWVNASAVAIYPTTPQVPYFEEQERFATGFLSEVVQVWEHCFFENAFARTRQVALRTSVVLGKEGGALPRLKELVRWRLGGAQGEGTQMFSWVHIEDYFRILCFLIAHPEVTGVVNCTAPVPVSNKVLMSSIRKHLKVSIGLPAPAFLIRIGARFIRTEASLILDSSYVVPGKLLESHFHFLYPTIDQALSELWNT